MSKVCAWCLENKEVEHHADAAGDVICDDCYDEYCRDAEEEFTRRVPMDENMGEGR